MTADTAYSMWGVAQPGIPKTGPTKWLRDDCHRADIMTLDELHAKLHSFETDPHAESEYCMYWAGYYRRAVAAREHPVTVPAPFKTGASE
jgi:hypothetical protein